MMRWKCIARLVPRLTARVRATIAHLFALYDLPYAQEGLERTFTDIVTDHDLSFAVETAFFPRVCAALEVL